MCTESSSPSISIISPYQQRLTTLRANTRGIASSLMIVTELKENLTASYLFSNLQLVST